MYQKHKTFAWRAENSEQQEFLGWIYTPTYGEAIKTMN
jgi:malic enzyme